MKYLLLLGLLAVVGCEDEEKSVEEDCLTYSAEVVVCCRYDLESPDAARVRVLDEIMRCVNSLSEEESVYRLRMEKCSFIEADNCEGFCFCHDVGFMLE